MLGHCGRHLKELNHSQLQEARRKTYLELPAERRKKDLYLVSAEADAVAEGKDTILLHRGQLLASTMSVNLNGVGIAEVDFAQRKVGKAQVESRSLPKRKKVVVGKMEKRFRSDSS